MQFLDGTTMSSWVQLAVFLSRVGTAQVRIFETDFFSPDSLEVVERIPAHQLRVVGSFKAGATELRFTGFTGNPGNSGNGISSVGKLHFGANSTYSSCTCFWTSSDLFQLGLLDLHSAPARITRRPQHSIAFGPITWKNLAACRNLAAIRISFLAFSFMCLAFCFCVCNFKCETGMPKWLLHV